MKYIAVLLLLTLFAGAEKKKEVVKKEENPQVIALEKFIKARSIRSGESMEWASKEELHKKYIKKFIAAPDFGASRIVRIDMDRFKTLTVDSKNYRVRNMELVSVTDRKKPVLWKTNGIVNRTFLEKKFIKSRELTAAEKQGFNKLKSGETFITAKENGLLTMMGTLKAETSCVRCHEDYKIGEFMGAFKYTFDEAGTSLEKVHPANPVIKKIEKKGKSISEPEVG